MLRFEFFELKSSLKSDFLRLQILKLSIRQIFPADLSGSDFHDSASSKLVAQNITTYKIYGSNS